MDTINKCPFCIKNDFFHYRFLSETIANNTPLCVTDNFMILPDISPLVEGHLLLVPHKHEICFGSLIRALRSEFVSIKKRLRSFFNYHYCEPLIFEHGPSKQSPGSSSVDHAHLHFLPVSKEVIKATEKVLEWCEIESIDSLYEYALENLSYLFFQYQNKSFIYKLQNPNPIPSQFLRMIIAQRLNNEKWNWKELYNDFALRKRNLTIVIKTVRKYKEYFGRSH